MPGRSVSDVRRLSATCGTAIPHATRQCGNSDLHPQPSGLLKDSRSLNPQSIVRFPLVSACRRKSIPRNMRIISYPAGLRKGVFCETEPSPTDFLHLNENHMGTVPNNNLSPVKPPPTDFLHLNENHMGTVPSNNYTFDLLVEADDHAWAPAVADNGPGKEDIGAAGFAPGHGTKRCVWTCSSPSFTSMYMTR